MQFKLALITAALATLVAAGDKCSTGPIQCCQSTQTVAQALTDSNTLGLIGGLIGIVLEDLTAVVGLTCSGVNVAGGGTCTAQTVCCQNNAQGGLISVGCLPVTL